MNRQASSDRDPRRPGDAKETTKVISIAKFRSADHTGPPRPDQVEASGAVSSSAILAGFTRNDPRVVAALDAYLEDLRAGRHRTKDAFLAEHADIADELRNCLSALEFVQGAAAQLSDSQLLSTAGSTDSMPRRAGWVITALFARSGVAEWALFTRPSRSLWAGGLP